MNIVLVEDSAFYAEELIRLLDKHPELQVVDHVSEENEAVSSIMRLQPDAVILDLSLKNGHGLGVLRRIRTAGSDARVFVLTNHSGAVIRDACLEAGAVNVFDKSSEVLDCIQSLLRVTPDQVRREEIRLQKINEIQLLGVQAVEELDGITELAALLLGTPIATISLVDDKRLWNVSHHGTDQQETTRFNSFSAHTILGTELLEFDNAHNDPRFADSPLVNGDAAVRYYAGAPLVLPTGESIGALCVMDRVSHQLTDVHKKTLAILAKNAVSAIMLRGRMRYLEHEVACLSGRLNEVGLLLTKDALTSLPNEIIFKDRLGQLLKRSERDRTKFAVLYLDLIDFKSINQAFGKEMGDSILVAFAERIANLLRKADTVARLSGNRFAILLPDIRHEADVLLIANKIRNSLRRPWPSVGQAIYLDCCMGVSLSAKQGNTVEDYCNHANAALQVAKCKAKANQYRDDVVYIVFHDEQFIDEKMLYANIEVEFREALEKNELTLYCQPQLGMADGNLMGLEFLVRWNHPRLGMLSPDYFIPYAEQSGLITALTDQVLDMALQQTHRWLQSGMDIPRVSINISGTDVRPGLSDRIQQALHKHEVPPQHLEIEITETAMASRGLDALEELQALAGMKVSIAVDDFGTGFSSLSRIQSLPISCIKIDQGFTQKVEHSRSGQAIVQAIVAMAHAMNLSTIVEGVETKQQHQFFRQLGADGGQGFFYAKPMTTSQFEGWLSHDRSSVSP